MVRLLQSCVLHLGAKRCSCFVPEGGLSSPMGDFISSLECVADHALDNDIRLVLFAGDAHKTCAPPRLRTKGRAECEFVRKSAVRSQICDHPGEGHWRGAHE